MVKRKRDSGLIRSKQSVVDSTTYANPHLCSYCQSLFENIKKIPYPPTVFLNNEGDIERHSGEETEKGQETFNHWPTFDKFLGSVSSGCHLCTLWLLKIPSRKRALLEGETLRFKRSRSTIEIVHCGEQFGDRCNYEIYLLHALSEEEKKSLDSAPEDQLESWEFWQELRLVLESHEEGDTCSLSEDVPRAETVSMEKVAASWISTCIASHKDCAQEPSALSYNQPAPQRASKSDQYVPLQNRHLRPPRFSRGSFIRPSRLVAVGSNEDFSDVRLCSSSIIQPGYTYVTLSHCWGPQGLSYKLMTALEECFMGRLPWAKMPQTFKDAIVFTRRLKDQLGVSYLWIDALCIIQDSPEDWRHESSIMGHIYKNALCNFAASSGTNSHHGLLQARNTFTFHKCIVKGGKESALQGSFSIRSPSDWFDQLDGSPLSTRAWVHQEILLAPRVLYFTPLCLFWKCSSLCASEKDEELIDSPIPQMMSIQGLALEAYITAPGSDGADRADVKHLMVYDFWHHIVRDYSKGEITYPGDRLIAISGLAKETQSLMRKLSVPPSEYVAGLWMCCLTLGMLWYVDERRAMTRLEGSCAPTWSWASVKGEVGHAIEFTQDSKALVPPMKIVAVDAEYVNEDSFGQLKSATVRLRGSLLKYAWPLQASWRPHQMWQHQGSELIFDTENAEIPQEPSSFIYYLPCMHKEGYREPLHPPPVVGLLLEKAEGAKGYYRRCGFFKEAGGISPDFLKEAERIPLLPMEYHQRSSNGSCTISVI